MPISAYSSIRDDNALIEPGNIRSPDFARDQQIINSIRQLMADLAAFRATGDFVDLNVSDDLTVDGQSTLTGTTTNDNAAAGKIGEYIEGVLDVASATALVTNVPKTVTSISLTAGDWDVYGNIGINPAATTSIQILRESLSLVTNTLDTTPGRFAAWAHSTTVIGANAARMVLGAMAARFSLAATTTIFLVADCAFTVSTNEAYGKIWARRAR